VNDGSTDNTVDVLKRFAADNSKVKIVSFSRNFGHEAAMIAGIDYAIGDGVVCMDADLEHPPECIPQIIAAFEAGNDVVSMVCTNRSDAGPIRRLTSRGFYRVLNMVSPIHFEENASDFFGITRRVADVLRKDYRERVELFPLPYLPDTDKVCAYCRFGEEGRAAELLALIADFLRDYENGELWRET
jgi:dolichol-phosphate mannosyltransferase